ncbi:bifunctional DNA-formamidopyrimidine glycosylase/DNA-(apurinic or apyrimidinic site) lyase [Allonocardiopsis opalescens]|uniref:Formamidopyrimidine-DNA glycosylase n=1 Tax=Allonocardiopsis opalescens TaxID=1144618 RepID=A0A2T0PVR8_9ACTN|nr:bifunctional DNA-formamidopyrimidine glycosylase/DNA-(apurinic or apyrimidinic site) lyase [Allonocardiopsis opalescens]PRX95635.1 DNA-(apurinic or apyrimidinic site) lyase [Allonocardiopsis opalescens]
MPELPEVEVVRRGLEQWVVGRTIAGVSVYNPRSVRRHTAGGADFGDRLRGLTVTAVRRRGKYLWLPLDTGDAVLAHLGMSGQLLVQPPDRPDEKHLRVRIVFTGPGGAGGADRELRFVDQRTFGHLMVVPGGAELPAPIAHIAPDPFESAFDPDAFAAALRRRRTGLKRALLDQSLISGVGNIYADEALWLSRQHWARATETLTAAETAGVLDSVRTVMSAALREGGTSFDSLYVNVNGESGYFDRSLRVYGRRDEPCVRCGTPIRRDVFMNRSSFSCPTCQPVPEGARL